jgi:FxsC-like protein
MPLFFLSYARADRDPHLDKFYDDLVSLVRRKTGLGSNDDVAFRDVRALDLGDRWSDEICAALASAKSLVCLCSPTYFNREWCRKELVFFRNRLAKSTKNGNPPPLILPLRWYPELKTGAPFPKAVMDLQHQADYGNEYEKEGLQFICRLNKYSDLYEEILTQIANRIIEVTTRYPISDAPVPAQLDAVDDLAVPAAAAGGVAARPDRGPRHVQFILAAASREELQGIRNGLDAYGDSGADWCPYMPPNDRSIGPVLQALAAQEHCTSEIVSRVDDLIPRLRQALETKNMVIILVDPWALQIGTYAAALQEYDERDFLHCAVIVPWNETDQETVKASGDLHELLKQKLTNKVLSNDPKKLRSQITSPEQLEAGVRELLVELRKRIIERADVVRKMGGGQVIAKPLISAVRS